MASFDCDETRRLAAEIALGIADGAERASALEHLDRCRDCRAFVKELSQTADDLLLLAPIREPPLGFESRVLGRLRRRRPSRLPRFAALAAAGAAVAAAAVLATLHAVRDDRELGRQYRTALARAHGTYFGVVSLDAPGGMRAGTVFDYAGDPSWIFVTVPARYRNTSYRAELVTHRGRRIPLPALRIDQRHEASGQAIPVELRDVAELMLVGETPGQVLVADFDRARSQRR